MVFLEILNLSVSFYTSLYNHYTLKHWIIFMSSFLASEDIFNGYHISDKIAINNKCNALFIARKSNRKVIEIY